MDASTLRWTIIVIGVVILAAIFLFGNPDKKRKPKASRRALAPAAERREPTLGKSEQVSAASQPNERQADEVQVDEVQVDEASGQVELPINQEPELAPEPPSAPRKPAGPPPDMIITLFVLARDNHVINGTDLLQAALKTGMAFGDMNIFHRQSDGVEQPVFSLANATKPGFFDKEAWNTFETSGVALFLTLPGPMLALDAWDTMLATARRIAEILNAELQDSDHTAFTRQKEAKIREEMRAYDRNQARQSLH